MRKDATSRIWKCKRTKFVINKNFYQDIDNLDEDYQTGIIDPVTYD